MASTAVVPITQNEPRMAARAPPVSGRIWDEYFRVTDARDQRVVAEGSTVQVYYDYTTRQATPIPDDVRTLLETGKPDTGKPGGE